MNVRERTLLSLETAMSLGTVSRWDKGGKVYESTKITLEKAAKKLGLLEKRECERVKKTEAAP